MLNYGFSGVLLFWRFTAYAIQVTYCNICIQTDLPQRVVRDIYREWMVNSKTGERRLIQTSEHHIESLH